MTTVYELILVGVLFGICTMESFWQILLAAARRTCAHILILRVRAHAISGAPSKPGGASQEQAMEFHLTRLLKLSEIQTWGSYSDVKGKKETQRTHTLLQ